MGCIGPQLRYFGVLFQPPIQAHHDVGSPEAETFDQVKPALRRHNEADFELAGYNVNNGLSSAAVSLLNYCSRIAA
jgi:hypothetical protein